MYWWVSGFSPRAFRNRETFLVSPPSSTIVSPHTCLSSSSFVSTRSRLSMSARSVSNTFGASGTGSPLRNRSRLMGSAENGPNS